MPTATKPLPNAAPLIAFKRPLVDVWAACAALDCSEDAVVNLVDEGRLRFAFNLASRHAHTRRCIRILSRSLAEFQAGAVPGLGAMSATQDAAAFAEALKLIFPALTRYATGGSTVRVTTIGRKFNMGTDHVLNLCDENSLRLVPGTVRRRGPNGSPQVDFASVAKFLAARRLS